MKKILITGATGFIGSNLAHAFLERGHEIHALVRASHKPWRLRSIASEILFHEVSLKDEESMVSVIKSVRPDWIFHTAVHGAYSSQTNLKEMVDTNIVGTMNLVQAALHTDFEAFINTGSSSEYGYKDHAPNEKEWIEPNSHYAVTKACATQFCRFTAQKEKRPMYTVRLYSAYGPYEEPTRLMPTLITKGLTGQLPPLVGPTISRDYIYIDDIIAAYETVARSQQQETGAAYNVGTGKQTSLKKLVSIVRERMNIPQKPVWGSMPNRQWDTSYWVADNSAIKRLGWKPQFSVDQGLQAMINWQRSFSGNEYSGRT